ETTGSVGAPPSPAPSAGPTLPTPRDRRRPSQHDQRRHTAPRAHHGDDRSHHHYLGVAASTRVVPQWRSHRPTRAGPGGQDDGTPPRTSAYTRGVVAGNRVGRTTI